MSEHPIRILLCTNGSEKTRPALEYGAWLADVLESPVVLLGVVEAPDEQIDVDARLAEAEQMLKDRSVAYEVKLDKGRGSDVIAHHTAAEDFLTVVGPLGRPIWRRVVQGRSFRRLLAKIETPIFYVPKVQLPLKRILVCVGGLGYAEGVEHLCLFLARRLGAEITLLHVVEPITLDYPTAQEVQENWEKILETDTPQGRNLRSALEEMRTAGISVEFKVRQGNVVHEIIDEVRSSAYDLIGMGSPHSAHSLRHLYMPNVTAEVAETLQLPVLTVRKERELVD